MFQWFKNSLDSNEKVLKKLLPIITKINALEPEYTKLPDYELKAKTPEFKDRLVKAVADAQNRVDTDRQELQDAKKRLAEAEDKFTAESGGLAVKQLQERLEQVEKELVKAQNDALDDLLPEAFAAVREASKRAIGLRFIDVQLLGGIVLQHCQIAEIKKGEGSALVAALPLYLNSLISNGVHFVTSNDYLAKTSAYYMGPVYDVLGVSVASIQGHQVIGYQNGSSFFYAPQFDSGKEGDQWRHFRPVTRKEAYLANIVYGSNIEFGLDYLRDNMVVDLNQIVQSDLNYAIVDEVDNVLIDNAQTPIIISSPVGNSTMQKYILADKVVRQLISGTTTNVRDTEAKNIGFCIENDVDYFIDKKSHTIRLTQRGTVQIQNKLNLENLREFQLNWEHYIRQAIMANELYKKNKEYVINNGKVVIVDEFTGRMMHGRRYSDGLHQAIEAKEVANGERVQVEEETRTYATITFQNYFRMYHKLAGMTDTAVTELEEFHMIYKLEVVMIPTNKPMLRQDLIDKIYKNEQAKFNQVIKEVEELHKEGRPILIGTVSVEKSEKLSDMMTWKGVKHEVLNAKLHEKEAYIVAQAGRLGTVTVATNMAGRGVDIILGGRPDGRDVKEWQKEHDEVVQKGGLHIIGTERHEARRFDNQLRSLAGIRGDSGSSRFYVSLEDDILQRFGDDRVGTIMALPSLGEDVPIENSMVNRTVESAQIRAELFRMDLRKQQSLYEDVLNNQRKIIYGERRKILSGTDIKTNVLSMIGEEIIEILRRQIDEPDERIIAEIKTILPLPKEFNEKLLRILDSDEIKDRLMLIVEAFYKSRERELGVSDMRILEKLLFLRIIDLYWVEHLTNMDNARQNTGSHVISQGNPLAVYKHEAYELFEGMMKGVRHDLVHNIFHFTITKHSGNVSLSRLS